MAQKALSLTFHDTQTLHAAYMPWLQRGGIFVPTSERYSLGDTVYLLVTLPEESERLPVSGSVAWLSPPGIGGRRVPGIGVHFSADDQRVKTLIEACLDGVTPTRPSYTL
ncbi:MULTISPECIES: PilZ domain-containing protein [Chromohalobacter]|uniref:Type IV pilus assembly PilZ n=1 Tax=Chromohalobacter israelensis (strain ATCC BAA-138 / DSM 3043 / CIP 106854 / NCIMB 13768 / 1H11) TaxID=290398 RepID=Q1QX47_CHRI1|nr:MULTISPECIES: PilZ domain-containing protein [Chromohalobacter]ABE58961.1 type IV pilus assembly PilZ [Chromohalobacter salexigens DSM 3043]MBZ5876724.1 PilZ domain-containing protein [Chromohalobacter salexigens]MDO0945043.1 PilZ domain-containing protein [Chromohalobacter salexigens]NQY44432.1 PilZ domain-containing protein [Chromohalobacter sp.]NWO57772.1 pilus assembly protein PilZ [Chromohalobacter salexigens]